MDMGLFTIVFLVIGITITLLVFIYRSITTSDTNNGVNTEAVDTGDVSTSHQDYEDQSHVHVKSISSFDWEEHEMAITDPDYRAKLKTDFLQWKLAKDLYQIEKKYAYANTVEKQKEIDDLLEMIEILRKHFSPEKWKQIPKDPEQQTELQKLIVNAPPPDLRVDPIKNFAEYLIKDPETGMYYHKRRGVPEIPPNWKEDYLEWNYQKSLTVPWDYTRDWFYNAMKLVLSWGRET